MMKWMVALGWTDKIDGSQMDGSWMDGSWMD